MVHDKTHGRDARSSQVVIETELGELEYEPIRGARSESWRYRMTDT